MKVSQTEYPFRWFYKTVTSDNYLKKGGFIEERRILNSFTITFGKIIKCIDYAILTLRVECGDERLKKLLNYSTELGMLTKLKNNKLISDAAYEKIKTKIMNQYGVTSELMI